MRFNQRGFIDFALRGDVVDFYEVSAPLELSSGRTSTCYINWKRFTSDAWRTEKLAESVLGFALDHNLQPACYYGVEEGNSKLGLFTQLKWAKQCPDYGPGSHPLPMGRAVLKTRGPEEERRFLGRPYGGVVLLEDAVTTAGSLIQRILEFNEDPDIEVIAAIALTDRMHRREDGKSAKEAVEATGVPFFSMSTAFQLIPPAYKKIQPGEDIGRALEAEYRQYGVSTLKLVT